MLNTEHLEIPKQSLHHPNACIVVLMHSMTQHAKMDLNTKSLPKQKTIKTLKVITQGFKITMNENSLW